MMRTKIFITDPLKKNISIKELYNKGENNLEMH